MWVHPRRQCRAEETQEPTRPEAVGEWRQWCAYRNLGWPLGPKSVDQRLRQRHPLRKGLPHGRPLRVHERTPHGLGRLLGHRDPAQACQKPRSDGSSTSSLSGVDFSGKQVPFRGRAPRCRQRRSASRLVLVRPIQSPRNCGGRCSTAAFTPSEKSAVLLNSCCWLHSCSRALRASSTRDSRKVARIARTARGPASAISFAYVRAAVRSSFAGTKRSQRPTFSASAPLTRLPVSKRSVATWRPTTAGSVTVNAKP